MFVTITILRHSQHGARDIYKESMSAPCLTNQMPDEITEWKGGNLCTNWCKAEHGSSAADACISCFLPCYTYAYIQQKNNPVSSFCQNFMLFAAADYLGFGCCLTCVTRSHVYPTEPCCHNCMSSMCCQSCALIQVLKTIEKKDANGNIVPLAGDMDPLLQIPPTQNDM